MYVQDNSNRVGIQNPSNLNVSGIAVAVQFFLTVRFVILLIFLAVVAFPNILELARIAKG